jgi:hypothetical protein
MKKLRYLLIYLCFAIIIPACDQSGPADVQPTATESLPPIPDFLIDKETPTPVPTVTPRPTVSSSSTAKPTASPISVVENTLKINSAKTRLGIEKDGQFIERQDKKFSAGEKIIIKVQISGFIFKDSLVSYNEDIVLNKDNKELLRKENIFGTKGNNVEVADTSILNQEILISTDLLLPDTISGNINALILIRDLNSNKFASFQVNFSLD